MLDAWIFTLRVLTYRHNINIWIYRFETDKWFAWTYIGIQIELSANYKITAIKQTKKTKIKVADDEIQSIF